MERWQKSPCDWTKKWPNPSEGSEIAQHRGQIWSQYTKKNALTTFHPTILMGLNFENFWFNLWVVFPFQEGSNNLLHVVKWYMSVFIGYRSGVKSQRLWDHYILSAMAELVLDCCVVKRLWKNEKYSENNIFVIVRNCVKLNWRCHKVYNGNNTLAQCW